MNTNTYMTSIYAKMGQLVIQKNKANSKPIKPNLSQFQYLQSQNKAKTNPISKVHKTMKKLAISLIVIILIRTITVHLETT